MSRCVRQVVCRVEIEDHRGKVWAGVAEDHCGALSGFVDPDPMSRPQRSYRGVDAPRLRVDGIVARPAADAERSGPTGGRGGPG